MPHHHGRRERDFHTSSRQARPIDRVWLSTTEITPRLYVPSPIPTPTTRMVGLAATTSANVLVAGPPAVLGRPLTFVPLVHSLPVRTFHSVHTLRGGLP